MFQVGPGKTVLRDFADAAVLHISAEQLGQHHADLTFALAAPALDNHHPLALVAGNEAVTYKLLDSRNIFRVEQIKQEPQPVGRLGRFGVVSDRHHFRLAFPKAAVQVQGTIGQVDTVGDWREIIHLGGEFQQVQNAAYLAGHVVAGVVLQFRIDGTPQRHLICYPAIFGEKETIAENNFVGRNEGLTENRFVDPVAFFQPDRVIGAGPIFLVFHAASSLSRVLRRDSTIGRS